jgi:hypothetical protein
LAGLTFGGATLLFVLISRRHVAAPASPSPVRFPEWFPHWGGREIDVSIADSMRDLRVAALNDEEVGIGQICQLVLEVDMALARRIRDAVASGGATCAQALVRAGFLPPTDVNAALAEWEETFKSVSDVGSYRLDVRGGRTPLALAVRVLASSSPDTLNGKVQELGERLGCPPFSMTDLPLPAVLYRPVSIKGAPAALHGLLISVFAAYNTVNAAAHASQYARFGTALLLTTGREVRRGLQAGLAILQRR